ncbi:hypothetical protein F4801DRAFT_202413 [Xylaria longipes]|nr:hypothetical protein F4801DRAFT_202413 [Xylaria longipes]RYC59368.1 hypothetical protein CHU98_g6851 [Xylaria longipes]
MGSPINDEGPKLSLLTVSTKEIIPKPSNLSVNSTPTSAYSSNGFDADLEGMKPAQSSENLRGPSISGNRTSPDSSVWPGQAHWKQKAIAAERKNRSCQCLARLSKRNRIILQVAVVLLVVGVAVGVGFGVSKSLGARTWQPKDGR